MYLHIFLFIEMSETLTNNTTADQASIGTFNDEQSADRVENSNVNMDTFMEELDSLVDQPIANDDASIIENGHNNNNREEEPKKVETKNVDIDEFLGELDSLIDVEHPELVLEPVLMTELESKQVSELETVMALGAEPVTELVVPESLKLSDPAQQDDVVDSNEKFKNVQENFATVPSSALSSNDLENTATKIKDGKLYICLIIFGFTNKTGAKNYHPVIFIGGYDSSL